MRVYVWFTYVVFSEDFRFTSKPQKLNQSEFLGHILSHEY